MAATGRTSARAQTEPALPLLSQEALDEARHALRKEWRRSATRQLERFERRPGLIAVEEDDEVWWDADLVPCCTAPSMPKPHFDVVEKEHPKLNFFQERVLLVEHGWLYWYTDVPATQPSLARLYKTSWRGCVDLASTPCQVKAVDGSDTLFIVEPCLGFHWSMNDVHSRVGKRQAFVFKARNPQQRQNWMHAIYQHMDYKSLPSAPSMPMMKPDKHFIWKEPCSVCSGDLGDASSICKTPCNHVFHSECLSQWLAVDGTCPFCRSLLCRPPRRPLQPWLARILPFRRASVT